jgi:hypothetical protein
VAGARARVALSLAPMLFATGCAVFGYDFADVELATAPGDAAADVRGDSSAGACVPLTCRELGAQCGKILDGCGAVVNCGGCEAGVCGGGGKNRCGAVPADL